MCCITGGAQVLRNGPHQVILVALIEGAKVSGCPCNVQEKRRLHYVIAGGVDPAQSIGDD